MKNKLRVLFVFAVFLLLISITTPIFAAEPENLVKDPSFEEQTDDVAEPWRIQDDVELSGIDAGDRALTGEKNVWFRTTNGWNSVRQFVDVEKNTDYILTAYVKAGTDIKDIYFGVWPDGAAQGKEQVFKTEEFENAAEYTKLTFEFNSEEAERVDVFLGSVQSEGDNWVNVDDFSLVAAASDEEPAAGDDEGEKLPNTATPLYNSLLIGFSLILLGGIALFYFKRKTASQE